MDTANTVMYSLSYLLVALVAIPYIVSILKGNLYLDIKLANNISYVVLFFALFSIAWTVITPIVFKANILYDITQRVSILSSLIVSFTGYQYYATIQYYRAETPTAKEFYETRALSIQSVSFVCIILIIGSIVQAMTSKIYN